MSNKVRATHVFTVYITKCLTVWQIAAIGCGVAGVATADVLG